MKSFSSLKDRGAWVNLQVGLRLISPTSGGESSVLLPNWPGHQFDFSLVVE